MKRLIIFLSCLLALPVVSAQTAPELFVFEAGTPIKASEVNANFQLLRDQITTVIGAGNVTLDDLEDLAGVVEQLQAAFEAGELDGVSLEYEWDGTRLGVRQSGEAAYTYVDLRGAVGPMGPVGPVGPAGADGADGKDGVDGVDGAPGADGKDGAPGLDGKDGAQGPAGSPGEKGEPGTPGVDGAPGAPGAPGADGVDGVDGMNGTNGVDGAPGAPGADGADGRTLLNGPGAPSSSLGSDGDFYIDTANWQIYGPKSSGGWSVGASLIGPQGPKGDTGSGGGGLGSVRIDVSAHVTELGEWNEAHEAEVSCLPGEVLLDVTVSSTPETYIYEWIIGIEQVSATTSVVKVSKDPNNGIPFTLYTKCLGAAS